MPSLTHKVNLHLCVLQTDRNTSTQDFPNTSGLSIKTWCKYWLGGELLSQSYCATVSQ